MKCLAYFGRFYYKDLSDNLTLYNSLLHTAYKKLQISL